MPLYINRIDVLYNNVKDKKRKTCCLCHRPFDLDSRCLQLSCHHLFHTKCASVWLTEFNYCPICICKQHIKSKRIT